MGSPVADVVAALDPPGGTLAQIAERTGFPAGQVLKFIGHARREGVRVNAVMGERTPDGTEPTVFAVADDRNLAQPLTEEV